MKWCSGCCEFHPRSAFGRDASRPDGLSYRCKAWKNSDSNRRYSEAHAQREYYALHREERQAYHRQRYLERREYFYDANARRRGQLSIPCEHEACNTIDRHVVWGRDEGCCRIKLVCDGAFVPFEEMHLDHVVPLTAGGLHCYSNVQTGCAPCNLAKGARVLVGGD